MLFPFFSFHDDLKCLKPGFDLTSSKRVFFFSLRYNKKCFWIFLLLFQRHRNAGAVITTGCGSSLAKQACVLPTRFPPPTSYKPFVTRRHQQQVTMAPLFLLFPLANTSTSRFQIGPLTSFPLTLAPPNFGPFCTDESHSRHLEHKSYLNARFWSKMEGKHAGYL